jgi:catechol 2,3-dioxygenase-like lactoylglutathione lyase family enzyme
MRVKRIGYIGTRTSNVEGMTAFFRDVLGLDASGEDTTATFQRLPSGRFDLVEVYATEHHDLRMVPDEADFVVGFVVDDLAAAMAEVKAAGLEIVNQPVRAADAFDEPGFGDFSWFWVRAPDGRIYVIQQVPD